MPSSPDNLRVLLTRFASMAWSTASESAVLGLADLAWWSKFLLPKRNHLNQLVTLRWSTVLFFFAQQMLLVALRVVRAQFELLKHKFPNWITLYVYLCGFQIAHKRKHYIKCTNYHDATNRSKYHRLIRPVTLNYGHQLLWYTRRKLTRSYKIL